MVVVVADGVFHHGNALLGESGDGFDYDFVRDVAVFFVVRGHSCEKLLAVRVKTYVNDVVFDDYLGVCVVESELHYIEPDKRAQSNNKQSKYAVT